jgi:hypothetical protein
VLLHVAEEEFLVQGFLVVFDFPETHGD